MTTRTPAQQVLLGFALMVAVGTLVTTWSAIVRDPPTLLLAGGTGLLVLGIGVACRALRLPAPTALLAEIVTFAVAIGWLVSAYGGILRLPTLLARSFTHLESSVAPVAPTPGTTLLLCIAIGLVALIADLLVIVWNRPVLAVVPLLVLLLVPAIGPKDHHAPTAGMPLFALGLTLVLLASGARLGTGRRSWAVGAAALVAATMTAAVALVAATIIPPMVHIRPPLPTGATAIQMNDVSQDLRREIQRGADTPAFDYSTDDGKGAYLRLYSLPTFNTNGWHLTNSAVQTGLLPAAPGLPPRAAARKTRVTITGLESEWLPAPYAPIRTSAGDGWGFLPDSLSILSLAGPDRTTATAGLEYVVESAVVDPDTDDVRRAPDADPPDGDVTASVPSDITPALVQLANDITANEETDGGKALAILNYLRQPQFTYTLDAQSGSGYSGLEDFLLRDNRGFCVQYAASMATLARIVGVPSRLAIGFTPGRRVGDRWVVTMHDMHAWPEVYLGGLGWVAFDPTPGASEGGTAAEPPSATPSPTATPTPTESATPSAEPTTEVTPVDDTTAASGDAGGGSSGALVFVLLAAAAAVAATPWWLRGRRRRARLAPGRDPTVMALDAWTELRATARDYGRPWPDGSPRFAADALAGWLGDSPGADGIHQLAIAAERAQFGGAAHPPSRGDWSDAASSFADALNEQAPSRWVRIKARFLPASLVSR